MALARVHTFVSSATLTAAQLNNEFDNLVNVLNGTVATSEIVLRTNTAAPTLVVDQQTAAQPIADFRINTVSKVQINDDGQIVSSVATGVGSPFTVASTTVVTNLNADLLDGLEGSAYLAKNFDGETVITTGGTGPIMQMVTSGGGTDKAGLELSIGGAERVRVICDEAVNSGGDLLIQHYDGAAWDTVARTSGAANSKVLANGAAEAFATEAYADALQTAWAFGAFYEGEPTTAVKQARFIVPANVENCSVLKIEYVFGVAGTGTTTVRLRHYDSSGSLQATATTDILAAYTIDTTYSEDIVDMALSPGDFLVWDISDDSGTHQDISVWAHGVQEVI